MKHDDNSNLTKIKDRNERFNKNRYKKVKKVKNVSKRGRNASKRVLGHKERISISVKPRSCSI